MISVIREVLGAHAAQMRIAACPAGAWIAQNAIRGIHSSSTSLNEAGKGSDRADPAAPGVQPPGASAAGAQPSAVPGADPSLAAAAAAPTEDLKGTDEDDPTPRVVVFGGGGFVGSSICQAALAMGTRVTSISRSGRPAGLGAGWADQVEWVKGDALDPGQPWAGALRSAAGVASTLGAFGSNDNMYKVCGTANMRAMDAAAAAGVPRFAFISVHDYKMPAGWHAQDFLLRGYFQGKRDAERHLAATFPAGGVALRPGIIYGTRSVGGASVPLGLLFAPIAAALRALPSRRLAELPVLGAAFVPPLPVGAVARAAAAAALDPGAPPGVMSVWDIQQYR